MMRCRGDRGAPQGHSPLSGLGAWFDQRRRDAATAARQMPFWLVLHPPGHPDKRRLMTVHDFYEYTERKGVNGGQW